MSRVVHKYRLDLTAGSVTVLLPEGAQILTIQTQHEAPCLWALVDPAAPMQPVALLILGTGWEFDERDAPGPYVGTFQLHGGSLVFHVFREREASDGS